MPDATPCRYVLHALLLIAGLTIGLHLQGQEEGFLVTGSVFDKETGAPIENTNVSLKNTRWGTTTNAMGKFKLRVKTLPFIIECSFVGYESTTLVFEHKPMQEVKVFLKPSPEMLSEVTITSQRIDTLFADRIYSVLDYELIDTGIVLLIYKARLSRAELWLQDYDGNNLLKKRVLPMKPLTLYKDCLGTVHILSKDKSYQIDLTTDGIRLLSPYSIDHFHKVMSSCKFMVGERVYFEEYYYYDLIKKFYSVHTEDNTSKLLAVVRDEAKIGFLQQNPENFALNTGQQEQDMLNNMRGIAADQGILAAIRNMNVELRFNQMAYLSRIYAPMFALRGDSIVLFNHPNNLLQFYNASDSLIGSTEINYHLRESKSPENSQVYSFTRPTKWLSEVFVDPVRNKSYTLFQNLNGTKQLNEIDLKTGKITYRLSIPFPYVQKIQIRDGNVYFVYRGFGEGQKKKLFRQEIR